MVFVYEIWPVSENGSCFSLQSNVIYIVDCQAVGDHMYPRTYNFYKYSKKTHFIRIYRFSLHQVISVK